MKMYELAYVISSEITSEEAEAKAKELESAIQKEEGTVLKQLNPVAKMLSYPMKGFSSGFLGAMEFQLEPEKIILLKEILEKDGKILRHMLIIKKAAELKKERRVRGTSKIKPIAELEMARKEKVEKEDIKTSGSEKIPESSPTEKAENKGKVELKDIEQKLEELLGE